MLLLLGLLGGCLLLARLAPAPQLTGCPSHPPSAACLPSPPLQAAEKPFLEVYKQIEAAVAHMSAEEAAKEIRQMKPTVGWVGSMGALG